MKQRSEEWFAARTGLVTASIVGAILGNSPYMTRADAMRRLVRDAIGADPEFTGNVATEYGTANEAGAIIDYRLETTQEVAEGGFVTREDWAGASPDGLIGKTGGIEVKCPYSLRGAPRPVPFKSLDEQPHYYDQVQFTLWVTQREWWHFFQWAPNGTRLEVVKPDEEWQDACLPVLRQFHAELLHEIEHNADEHLAPKRVEIDTPEAARMMVEWDELAEQFERLAERKRDLQDAIVSLAGGKNALIAGRKVTQIEREGAVSYARVVKEHCPKVDLAAYRGKPSLYWKIT